MDIDDRDLPLADLIRNWPETAAVFFRRRMRCVGCPIGPFHTVVDACREYGLDEAILRQDLRSSIRSEGSGSRHRR